MTPFISMSGSTVTIDGSAQEIQSKITCFEDGQAVQLRRARQEESDFNWIISVKKIKTVILKHVVIYDDTDIKCLNWFIELGIKIEGSGAYLSPPAMEKFNTTMEGLMKRKIKVVEGSSLTVPILQGYTGMGRTEECTDIGKRIGFKIIW